MIKTIFPTNIIIKDYNLSSDWKDSIDMFTKIYFAQAIAEHGDYRTASEEHSNVFTEENMSSIPELKDLFEMFVDCFYELSCSYNSNLSRNDISEKLAKDYGKLTIMKNGDWKQVHNHDTAQAVGLFYLDDVDNEKHGGELVLHDPSFNSLNEFCNEKTFSISTVKHRMIVAPANIWHEVTPYANSAKDRYAVILDLHL